MKKRSLKNLKLNKKSISTLKSANVSFKGGEIYDSSNAIFLCEAQCFSVDPRSPACV